MCWVYIDRWGNLEGFDKYTQFEILILLYTLEREIYDTD